jgi:hypothetical protein
LVAGALTGFSATAFATTAFSVLAAGLLAFATAIVHLEIERS